MNARGLFALAGAPFHHEHPECSSCRHREPTKVAGWNGWCAKREKTLCCAKPRRCKEYEPVSPEGGVS